MSNVQNYKIGVVIDADASKLQTEAKKADKAIEGIGKQSFGTLRKELGETASAFGLIPDSASNLTSSLGQATGSVENIISAMGPAGAVAGGVAIGLTAVTAAGIAVTKTLFDLAKQASDYGSEFKDAQEITGLSIETLGALRFAAEQGGKTIGDVNSTVGKFVKTLASAKEGNKEAEATMTSLGVTSYDLETALSQAYKTISETTEGTDQMRAAQEAFGKSGAELLPMIKTMDGDLEKFKETARKLGVTLTEEDVKAADDFGDTLGLLQTQAKVAAAKFALEYAPQITGAMSDISKYFSDNSDEVRYWGKEVGDVITGTVESLKVLQIVASGVLDGMGLSFLNEAQKMRLVVNSMIDFISPLVGLLNVVGQYTNSGKLHTATPSAEQYVKIPTATQTVISTKKSGGKSIGAKSTASKSESDAMREQKRAAEEAIRNAEQVVKSYKDSIKSIENVGMDLAEKANSIPNKFGSISSEIKKIREETEKLAKAQKDLANLKDTYTVPKSSVSVSKAGDKSPLSYKEIEAFAREHGFTPTSGKRPYLKNKTSPHPLGFAVDVRTKDKTPEQIGAFVEDLLRAGYRIVDERKFKASKDSKGPHLHVEKNIGRESRFDPSLSYGTRDVGSLISLDAERVGKGIDGLGSVSSKTSKDVAKLNADLHELKGNLNFDDPKVFSRSLELDAVKNWVNGIERELVDLANNKLSQTALNALTGKLPSAFSDAWKLEDWESQSVQLEKAVTQAKDLNLVIDDQLLAKSRQIAKALDDAEIEERKTAALTKQKELLDQMTMLQPAGAPRKLEEVKTPDFIYSNSTNFKDGLFGDLKAQMSVFDEDGLARFKTNAEVMRDTMLDLGATGAGVMNQMADATATALTGWIMYGDGVGESLKKATAQILAQLATESAVKAIYQLAEGFAALIFNPPAAAIHFKSAALYGAVAVASGVAARGLSGGSKNGSAGSQNGTAQQQQQDNRKFDFVRNSDNVGSNQSQTNNQLQQTINELRQSIQQQMVVNQSLEARIKTQPSGVLVAEGIKQNPGLVSQTVTSEMSKNSTSASNFGRILGVS